METFENEPRGFEFIRGETRQLTILWSICCCSPIVYLGAAWLVKRTGFDGFLPLSADQWRTALFSVAAIAVVLQVVHSVIRYRSRQTLEERIADPVAYVKKLTTRSYILIGVSELPVFLGFCLFLFQGDLRAVFGFGIASMLLYAQSHPRSSNPAFEQID